MASTPPSESFLFEVEPQPAPLPDPAELVAKLNPEQRRAVETTEGPLLVLAGAGSGKTRVITTRVAYMVAKGTPPESILALTFTNKAAGEMKERIGALVGKERGEALFAGTFHSFCLELLRKHLDKIGFPRGFYLCDTGDQISTVKGAMGDFATADAKKRPGDVLAAISLFKSKLMTPAQALAAATDIDDELVAKTWERYEERLRHSRLLDFDDLLLRALELFDSHPEVLKEVQDQYRYLFVDEYQDTNKPQYEIVRRIAEGHGNLCVVGDDDQSIYGWRGADITNILSFEHDFEGCTVVKLETNYRSTSAILNAANRVIQNNIERHDKTLRAAREGGAALRLFRLGDEIEEAQFVMRDIQEKCRTPHWRLSDFVVLFRTAVQPRAIEMELQSAGIPYKLVGGQSFFDRKEVRDVLAYLRLLVNPNDEISLLRVINAPPRGIGRTSLDRVLDFAASKEISISSAFDRAAEIPGLSPTVAKTVADLRRLLATLGGMQHSISMEALIDRTLEGVNYRAELERCYPDPVAREKRSRSLDDIKRWAEWHKERKKRPSLKSFLGDLALNAGEIPGRGEKEEGPIERLTLMTLHAAKGLEFPQVYMIGLEEGLMPHGRSAKEGNIEEERRLMYVGITRAKLELTLSHTRERNKFGTRVKSMPSRFVYELKGTPPPDDWIPAGLEPEERKAAKKKAKRKARKRPAR
ncbi:MAG: UvrD-helicase domain-containing protein [Planctomycetota bacterium]|nr:UvrD-helicase domain-containing protein [Planctomycetota bacterium]